MPDAKALEDLWEIHLVVENPVQVLPVLLVQERTVMILLTMDVIWEVGKVLVNCCKMAELIANLREITLMITFLDVKVLVPMLDVKALKIPAARDLEDRVTLIKMTSMILVVRDQEIIAKDLTINLIMMKMVKEDVKVLVIADLEIMTMMGQDVKALPIPMVGDPDLELTMIMSLDLMDVKDLLVLLMAKEDLMVKMEILDEKIHKIDWRVKDHGIIWMMNLIAKLPEIFVVLIQVIQIMVWGLDMIQPEEKYLDLIQMTLIQGKNPHLIPMIPTQEKALDLIQMIRMPGEDLDMIQKIPIQEKDLEMIQMTQMPEEALDLIQITRIQEKDLGLIQMIPTAGKDLDMIQMIPIQEKDPD